MTTPVGLLTLVADTPALPGALCRGRAPAWDLSDLPSICRAMTACDRCPALARCRDWANSQPRSQLSGVIAGRLYEGPRK